MRIIDVGDLFSSAARVAARSATIDRLPDGMIVFSSDFPHVEGHQEAVALYDAQLEGVSHPVRENFFGRSAAELLAI